MAHLAVSAFSRLSCYEIRAELNPPERLRILIGYPGLAARFRVANHFSSALIKVAKHELYRSCRGLPTYLLESPQVVHPNQVSGDVLELCNVSRELPIDAQCRGKLSYQNAEGVLPVSTIECCHFFLRASVLHGSILHDLAYELCG